jgi:NAD(P)-dependent dehydrogenase (short-subunit alcohol dehydrogenase family)
MPKLDGKVSLVTGGTSGIGLAAANALAKEGAHVYITGRRDQSKTQLTRRADHRRATDSESVFRIGEGKISRPGQLTNKGICSRRRLWIECVCAPLREQT